MTGSGHLLLPGLFAAAAGQPRLPWLERALARAERSPLPQSSPERLFCRLLGLDAAPVAALTALADGLDGGSGGWLRCDPVSLLPSRDRLLLVDTDPPLHADEVESLRILLNRHLAADGLALLTPSRQRWYLHGSSLPELEAEPPLQALGSDHHPRFVGSEAKRWRRLFTELQMVLHTASVNTVREAAGQLPVNSLWPWGVGSLEGSATGAAPQLVGDHPLVGGAVAWLGDGGDGLLGLDDLRRGGVDLARLEAERIVPACEALQHGDLDRLTLYPGDGSGWSVTRSALRRFWRRPRPLAAWREAA